jgi:hypothetical protein
MSSLSLQKSVRTCTVDVGYANRIQSDRFLNPAQMVCPLWNGLNSTGQEVCPDSYNTKQAGCNSAVDRVVVENGLRPDYISYVTLNAGGIHGDIYGGNVEAHQNTLEQERLMQTRNKITGNFGSQHMSTRRNTSCTSDAYSNAMANMAQTQRQKNSLQHGGQAASNANYAGMY